MADGQVTISIVLENAADWTARDQNTVHRFRNLGEDSFRAFRDQRRVQIDLGDIDRASDRIAMQFTNSGLLRRAIPAIRGLLKEHNFDREALVEIT